MRTILKSKGVAPAAVGTGLALAMTLTACTPSVPGGADGSGGGDSSTLTLLLPDTVNSIDPALAFSTGGRQASWLIYEALVRTDPESGEAVPGLADSWEFSPTSASFLIKEGAMCADGSEITAGTVARNFERWKDPETNAPLVNNFFGSADFTVAYDDDARTVDVELTTAMPFLGAEPSFTQLGIVCDSALEDPDVLSTSSDGTGPYTVKEFVTGSHITLVRNDDYSWGPEGFVIEDLPENVELNIVEDLNTQVNLLLGGDADAALLQPDQLARMEGESGFTEQVSDTSVTMMMFNERDGYPTADEAVRRALAQAIDIEELTEVQTQGLGYVADFLRAPSTICVDQSAIEAAMPTGGITAAQATLEDAGYVKGDDGIYAKDGAALSVQLLQMEFNSAAAELVSSAWEELGIEVEVDSRGPAQAVDALYSGTGWTVSFVGMSSNQPTGFRPFFVGPAAPDGPNFGAIDNPVYAQKQAEASQVAGLDSCPLWIDAETAVVERADWMPTIATDSKWVLADGVSFFTDGAYVDPLTLSKN